MALLDAAQAVTQPRVRQHGVDGNGLIEGRERVTQVVAGGEQESAKSVSLGVAGRELKALLDGLAGGRRAAKAEFQLGHARPGKRRSRRELRCLTGRREGVGQVRLRLKQVGFGEEGGGVWRAGCSVFRAAYGG